ncbi:armadillo repeat-containing protein 6-like [Saccoglossus kowalevskii]|uniref:Armadillo repeat-containing protein 6-like n=1 Tax=Saccoglossus kowalevskii TaxID=10224 RepID=A0ABM0MNK2_SACKO|nr:PREDICTED: armadillo repeat-containing protein 6-like [Saccoglossus kowalevskii]
MASKRITQETFDNAVKENIEDFEMEPEEALEDAVKQFETQGIDLSNIIKCLNLGDGSGGVETKHAVVMAIDKLNELLQGDDNDTLISENLKKFKSECDLDFARRSLAATSQAYVTLYKLYEKYKNNADMLLHVVVALAAFLNGQPDIIDKVGIGVLLQLLQQYMEFAHLTTALLKTIRITCIMHETNRQSYVKQNLIPLVIQVLEKHRCDASVVRESCQTLRILTVDDDVRVPFGHAHDHAKMIVEEGALKTILATMQEHTNDKVTMSELCASLSRLAVRNDICQEIVDLGGLKLVLKILVENNDHKTIVKQVFGVLKAIAGNDNVKIAIVNSGGISALLNAMNQNQGQPQVCENGCAAIAAISLRNPANCRVVIQSGGAPIIVQVMKIHRDVETVQKQGCMAVRNIIARSREYCDQFLELGVEAVINEARTRHSGLEDEAKAALRDLGCKVELKELWKGVNTPLRQ